MTAVAEPFRHFFIEIRDPSRGHKLVTLIELLSPSNKRKGPDRDAYVKKQRDLLESDASLIEIDLLRSGERPLAAPEVARFLRRLDPTADYVVLVSPAWRRSEANIGYSVYPFGLREMLPCVRVPLREDEPEVLLDLQFVFNRTYDNGPFGHGAVDYTKPPAPPLAGADAGWAEALVRERPQR